MTRLALIGALLGALAAGWLWQSPLPLDLDTAFETEDIPLTPYERALQERPSRPSGDDPDARVPLGPVHPDSEDREPVVEEAPHFLEHDDTFV